MGCAVSKSLSQEGSAPAAAAANKHTGAAEVDDGCAASDALYRRLGCMGHLAAMDPAPIMMCDTRGFDTEHEREAAVKRLGVVDSTISDPRFSAITKLMAAIFQTPMALITLITEDRVWIKSKVGEFDACAPRHGSWCNYVIIPNTPEVLITEGAHEDARFAANPFVAGPPFAKFYAGAPLVGKGGMRFGTLCVMDLKRRSFTAEMYALLVNFASLVVQEMEQDAALRRAMLVQAGAAEGHEQIADLAGTAASGLALVDVRSRAWRVLYANALFAHAEGADCADECISHGFWDLFEPVDGGGRGSMMTHIDAAVAAGYPVRATVASKRTGQRVSMVLRPGASDQLSPATPAIGIPNWVPSEKAMQAGCHAGTLPGGLTHGGSVFEGPPAAHDYDSGACLAQAQLAGCFWFVSAEPLPPGSADNAAAGGSTGDSAAWPGVAAPLTPAGSLEVPLSASFQARSSAASEPGMWGTADVEGVPPPPLQTFSSQPLPEVLEGLEMGPLVGSGSFGKVYRGLWRGQVVAVKLVDCLLPGGTSNSGTGTQESAAVGEAELSKRLDHPCVVKTYEYAMRASQHSGCTGGTLWIVQQMCNHGTLIEAVDRGWMRQERSLAAPPDMRAVLCTLRDVAAGMAFLHAKDILHCDLTGNNVLLDARQSSEADPRPFCARVCDFGLAREALAEVSTAHFGTCSHMAPELMSKGILTPAADVWSFGVMCWELYSGVRAYVGLRMPHIVHLVTSGKGALTLPAGTPQGYHALLQSCLELDHTKRPSFDSVLSTIDQLLAAGPEQPTGSAVRASNLLI